MIDPKHAATARAIGALCRKIFDTVVVADEVIVEMRPELEALPGGAGKKARELLKKLDRAKQATTRAVVAVEKGKARIARGKKP